MVESPQCYALMVSAFHCYFGFCASAAVLYFAFSVCALFFHVASVYFYVAENAALSLASSAETEISAAASCQAAAGIVVVVVAGGLAAGIVAAGGCLAAAGIPAGAAGTWVAAASAEIGTESAVNTFCSFSQMSATSKKTNPILDRLCPGYLVWEKEGREGSTLSLASLAEEPVLRLDDQQEQGDHHRRHHHHRPRNHSTLTRTPVWTA